MAWIAEMEAALVEITESKEWLTGDGHADCIIIAEAALKDKEPGQ